MINYEQVKTIIDNAEQVDILFDILVRCYNILKIIVRDKIMLYTSKF